MASEIKVETYLTCSNGNFSFPRTGVSQTIDQTTPGGASPGTVSVATGGTTISFTEFTTPGIAIIRNLDTVNYVTLGGSTDQPFMLKAGESSIVRINPSATLKLIAHTAAVEVLIQILED